MVEFGYINVIESKTKILSFIDGIMSIFCISYLDVDDVVEPNKVIFELPGQQLIELNSYTIDKKYDSLKLSRGYYYSVPLYIGISDIDAWFQIDKEDQIVMPDYPIGTNIDPTSTCKYSRQYKTGYSSGLFVFGIWKLKGSSRFLIGWDEEKISRDLLLYLLNWIFIKNNTNNAA